MKTQRLAEGSAACFASRHPSSSCEVLVGPATPPASALPRHKWFRVAMLVPQGSPGAAMIAGVQGGSPKPKQEMPGMSPFELRPATAQLRDGAAWPV